MSYDRIDPDIAAWAKRHSLQLDTKSSGRAIRNVYLSSKAGECFQIWIDEPADGDNFVGLHTACVEGQGEDDPPRDWLVDIPNLTEALDYALAHVLDQMKPSVPYTL